MRKQEGKIVYSPSDLVRYVASPFASWMDRYYLENPKAVTPDEETEDQKLIAETGNEHERSMLEEFKAATTVTEIQKDDFHTARKATIAAINSRASIIYQAALSDERFAGFADFVVFDESEHYQIWDTNAQVRALQAALPSGARVGSVDKFQGQEAPVCILSLCSSYGEYGSRGLAFILDRNRINVALSRAQCLAVVVADPRIASATAGSINEMLLLNVFCKIVDVR